MPFEQLARLQLAAAPGKLQLAMLVPSQVAPQSPEPLHWGRPPRGLPLTGVQVPKEPGTSQAAHWSSHTVPQQTPSIQKAPLLHWVSSAQTSPVPTWSTQTPAEQYCPAEQLPPLKQSPSHSVPPLSQAKSSM